MTSDEEMKTMLRKDGLRWTGGVKVSCPTSKNDYVHNRSENNQKDFKIHLQCNVLKQTSTSEFTHFPSSGSVAFGISRLPRGQPQSPQRDGDAVPGAARGE